MSMKTTACRILDTMKISYTLHEYTVNEDELDAVTVAGKVGLPPEQVFKTLVLRGDKTGVLMCCIPGNAELDLKAIAAVSGNKKTEMVPVKEIQALTGYIRGGVSPLGVKKRYPFYLEASAEHLDTISISAGKRGLQIFLSGPDLIRATEAKLVEISR
ncbi:Cys-tRNA(Pro) deacylase [Tumebacillus flagellatus]|uniref:Cys-tRNA(Pro)/Cys-tRNA(Cys) deacylase n=1 Tax=Tumebacillus flagellatus TaxID=1157490 RepID=A0A074LPP5_9BACL|nr:Cys-tRNA(Pro) deacylase [Tumebacillus flagellatus]KEO81828.1 cysteinyl-tRNA(Pro) deacylase [Tumebacillus flagellatus]